MKSRLDKVLAERGMVASRSQAESFIRLGQVKVNGQIVTKPGTLVDETDEILSIISSQFVSRAALKLKSASETFKLDFQDKTVLDVGSSTGGFTQYALQQGAKKVIAVDVGTEQLHPSLRDEPRIELHEKTDIRDVVGENEERRKKNGEGHPASAFLVLHSVPDMVVADVSFISLREILPAVGRLVGPDAELVMMVKPQFEARHSGVKHKGVIKNDKMRREILRDFEVWVQQYFKIVQKADSAVPGSKGNVERFYLLKKLTSPR